MAMIDLHDLAIARQSPGNAHMLNTALFWGGGTPRYPRTPLNDGENNNDDDDDDNHANDGSDDDDGDDDDDDDEDSDDDGASPEGLGAHFAWAPHSELALLWAGGQPQAQLVHAESGQVVARLQLPEAIAANPGDAAPIWSPDGSEVAFTHGREAKLLIVSFAPRRGSPVPPVKVGASREQLPRTVLVGDDLGFRALDIAHIGD